MKISSNFDSGNIEFNSFSESNTINLSIKKDSNSDFLQWFHFRLQGAKELSCKLVIENAGETSYSDGWKDYQAVASYDRHVWFRVPTTYDGTKLTIDHTPEFDSVYYAYFTPYSFERHQDLISAAQLSTDVELLDIGNTVEGRDLSLLRFGTPSKEKRNIWVIARQHPGESMAEWFMEGLINRLLDEDDPVVTDLLANSVFYIVPSMNPDGAIRGNLRSNAAGSNLNREWLEPSLEKSPEVLHVRNKMDEIGVDLFLDIHGDEELPYNFVAACEGNPNYSDRIKSLEDEFKSAYMQSSPDFQDEFGYDDDEPGKADMSIACNHVGQRFDCLAFTIEMPFKDNANLPNETYGWSADRSMILGESVLFPIRKVLSKLR